MGVTNADPKEYIAKYGTSLKRAHEMPSFVIELEGQYKKLIQEQSLPHELEGDVDALRLVDLDKEGLSMYRNYLASRGINISGLRTPV